MSHMVIYRGTDGKPAYHEVEDIHDAVQYVEQLRNDQGVEHATIHRMEQVNFEYRPYFRVELRSASGELLSGGPAPAAVAAAPPAAPAAAPAVEAPPTAAPPQDVPAQAAAAPTVVETAAPAESAPSSSEPSVSGSDADNGVGARRGLFGR
ncbi:MAG: hypothetical protein R2733_07145 [Acidimicrobiales bacterium]